MDMRRLILSSIRDLRTFLLGLVAAGFGPLRAEALLRSDSMLDVKRRVLTGSRAQLG